jgi:hypothetical protein
MLPFREALKAAQEAATPEQVDVVLREVHDRLGEANSAAAVDSARQILGALIDKGIPTCLA